MLPPEMELQKCWCSCAAIGLMHSATFGDETIPVYKREITHPSDTHQCSEVRVQAQERENSGNEKNGLQT